LKKVFFANKKYNLRVADIVSRREKTFVILQCFFSNTFIKLPIDSILKDEKLLTQLAPREIKLLSEINCFKEKKQYLALTDDGAFLYNSDSECFYTVDELKHLSKDEHFLDLLDAKSNFLLGYLLGSKERKKPDKSMLTLIKG